MAWGDDSKGRRSENLQAELWGEGHDLLDHVFIAGHLAVGQWEAVVEEGFDIGRGAEDDEFDGGGAAVFEAVGDVASGEKGLAGGEGGGFAVDEDGELAFEDVEKLVFAGVAVEGIATAGLFDDFHAEEGVMGG